MKGLDTVGWYICTLHQLLGHEKAAAVIGVADEDPILCILCRYERGHATQQDVIERIGK